MEEQNKRCSEEILREAACTGDVDTIEFLLNREVDVNTKHAINGWTPLHWACKRNHFHAVALLLNKGADKNIKSEKGETPASVTTSPAILQLLGVSPDHLKSTIDQEAPIFVPNYIKNPSLSCKVETASPRKNTHNSYNEDLVLKIRVANTVDPDFIEVDLPSNALTYQNLMKLCCEELSVNCTQVVKLRKLPNTKIRRDKDVQRLTNFQEIEVVLYSTNKDDGIQKSTHTNGNTASITPTNNYQSISKKDQTILY